MPCRRPPAAILIGKTVTTEFANRHPGPTSNPHNPAAHAGRIVERLGGCCRRFHGAAGDRDPDRRLGDPAGRLLRRRRVQAELRPVPPAGMHPNTESLDTVGTMARSVEDIALFRAALMAIPYEAPRDAGAAAAPRAVPHAALGPRRAGGPGGARRRRRTAARRRGRDRRERIAVRNAPTSPKPSAATAPMRRRASMRRSCTATLRC